MGISWCSFDTVFCPVCVRHMLDVAKFMKHVDSWMYLSTLNVMFIFVFFFFVSSFFHWILYFLAAHCSVCFFLPSPVFSLHLSFILCISCPPLPLCSSSPLTTLTFGRGRRKLVDCPQLLDVDDMVKMREPDWKCVYTYLQEFYRGLVTKGLVKTKNSS